MDLKKKAKMCFYLKKEFEHEGFKKILEQSQMMIEITWSQCKIKLHQKKSQTAYQFQSVLWFQKVTVSKLLVFPVILSLWYKLPPREYRSLSGHYCCFIIQS